MQALDRTKPLVPPRSGHVQSRSDDYKGRETANLYPAFNVSTREVLGWTICRHRAVEFRELLARIGCATPPNVDSPGGAGS